MTLRFDLHHHDLDMLDLVPEHLHSFASVFLVAQILFGFVGEAADSAWWLDAG
jgi:hypothetical protein